MPEEEIPAEIVDEQTSDALAEDPGPLTAVERRRIQKHNARVAKNELEAEDENLAFYPHPPRPLPRYALTRMGLEKKKRRFLNAYDAYAGVMTRALISCNIDLEMFEKWIKEDEKFKTNFHKLKPKIIDRAKSVLYERIGLIKPRPFAAKISENGLIQTLKAMDPEVFGDKTGGGVTVIFNLPRPSRPGYDGGCQLPTVSEASSLPHLPS